MRLDGDEGGGGDFLNSVSHTPKSRGWLGSHSTYVSCPSTSASLGGLGQNLIGSRLQAQMSRGPGGGGVEADSEKWSVRPRSETCPWAK